MMGFCEEMSRIKNEAFAHKYFGSEQLCLCINAIECGMNIAFYLISFDSHLQPNAVLVLIPTKL